MSVVVSLEAFDLFDVVDVVLDFLELTEGFGGDYVPQIFFELHGQFNGIEGVEAVIAEGAFSGDAFDKYSGYRFCRWF